jgi:ADP-ribosyl-[dinitrogen reductase] hydrolase
VSAGAPGTLPVAIVRLGGGAGRIGLSHCPGTFDANDPTRDLAADLASIRASGAVAIVTCVETHELAALHVTDLGPRIEALGMAWLHLPIRDMTAPDAAFETAWRESGPRLHRWLSTGTAVHVHCRGGRGRAGTVAARLLIERGWSPSEAIGLIRASRPGAIETSAQEDYLLRLRAPPARP